MKKEYIALLDSGIGGISLLLKLTRTLPEYNFIYFGDNRNAPYGNKTKEELIELTKKNLNYIMRYNVKALVIACNTLSIKILPFIKQHINIKVFFVLPPIERVISNSKKNTLILATPITAKAIMEDKRFNLKPNLFVLGMPNLALDIENNKFNLSKVDFNKHIGEETSKIKVNLPRIHNLILGCTHYHFIKNKIFNHFQPLKVVDGSDYTLKKIVNFVKSEAKLKKPSKSPVIFIGENKRENKKFYSKWLTIGKIEQINCKKI